MFSFSLGSMRSSASAFPTDRREVEDDDEGINMLFCFFTCACASRLFTEGVAGDGDVEEEEVLLREVDGTSVFVSELVDETMPVVSV